MAKQASKNIFVMGDVHGHYEQFVMMLSAAELIDENLRWTGGGNILIQMGDIIDKGPDSVKTDELADSLQIQAAAAGGEFVRLIGNHELELIMGNFFMSELDRAIAQKYREKLTAGVIAGRLKAAFHARGLLFTHAGACNKLLNIFKMQLGVLTETKVASLINSIFINCVKHRFYKHPVFNISVSRGGTDKYGGIFWEDLQDLYASFPRSPVKQVVGHSMVDEIVINADKNIIAVDVGLHRTMQYLKITDANLEIFTIS
ncbi:MAG: metallophosphoesterase [Elusimicrobium sp.]|jgi:hypothetical protein|nr:metallophosphoesterase [Elusimicrobium sp.]